MTPFQWLALTALALLLARELAGLRRPGLSRTARLIRCVVWAAAALAIAFPDLVSAVAHRIGIGRGADVVLYLFVLAFLGTAFYFHSRHVRLQRQVTQLVRHLAIREGARGPAPAETPAVTPTEDRP